MMINRSAEPENSDFDLFLAENLPDKLPADIPASVTPWRRCFNFILIGTVLGNITFHFLNLNVFLPALGVLLTLLGYRLLRQENKWFYAGFVFSCIRMADSLLHLILCSTIFSDTAQSFVLFRVWGVFVFTLFLIQPFLLWRGILCVLSKAGLPAHAKSAFLLGIWQLVILLFYLISVQNLLVMLMLICVYAVMIYSLFRLSRVLDEAGYLIQPARVYLSEAVLSALLAGIAAAGILCGFLFLNQYPMKWQPQPKLSTQAEEAKQHLAELGFPQDVLDDLLPEDLLLCRDARFVVSYCDEYEIPHTDGTAEHQRFTAVGVLLPQEQSTWRLFHHFRLTDGAPVAGTESIELWTVNRTSSHRGWSADGDFTGQVLCNQGENVYAAPFYRLTPTVDTPLHRSAPDGTQTNPFAEFSYLPGGTDSRCYLAYNAEALSDGWIIDSTMHYTHQRSRLQFPVLTAKQKRISTAFNEAGAFYTVFEALQLRPTENGAVPLF